jgi:site-specific DNA recombinase
MKVALYARVSSDEQAERQTIQAQITFLRQYTSLYNIPIYAEYLDDGVTGTIPLHERPQGKKLPRDAQSHKFDSVLFYKVDRLSRSLKHLLAAHDQLAEFGVSLKSASEPFDTSTAIGRFIMAMLGSMAELERENILERTRQGHARRKAAGKYHGGVISYGFKVIDDRLQVDEPEMGVVRMIFNKVASGATTISMAEDLNQQGVFAGHKYANNHRQAIWHPSRISKIILDRRYQEYVGLEVFLQAKQVLENNSNRPKSLTRINLLRGLIKCPNCGKTMIGGQAHGRNKINCYYRCHTPGCKMKNFRADVYEDLIWRACKDILLNPEFIFERIKARSDEQQFLPTGSKAGLQHELDLLRQQERWIMKRYEKSFDKSAANQELDELDQKKLQVEYKLNQLARQEELTAKHESFLEQAKKLIEKGRQALPEVELGNDRVFMRQIIELLIAEIQARHDGELRVYFRLDLQATLKQTMGDKSAWGFSGKDLVGGTLIEALGVPDSPIS